MDTGNRLSFAVLQAGARMHYAVPALLAQTQQLQVFYTDLHAEHRWMNIIDRPELLAFKPIQRLLGRQLPPEIPRSLVSDHPLLTLSASVANKFLGLQIQPEQAIFKRAIKDKFSGASALYTNFINNDITVVQAAKNLGLFCIHELIIGADVGRVLLEEHQRFPGIEQNCESAECVEAGIERDRQKWDLADRILVPSDYCFESSVALGADPQKIRKVPYGIHPEWLQLNSQPQPGRVLFVGQVGLRKGNHYLAAATRQLIQRRFPGEVRVAGPWLADITHPLFEGPTYLGQVPRSHIHEEFCRADVFVLPTLADSFGLVHLEALACGVPVITTPHCGSVVRDGIDGFIVPIRDAQILADRIEQLTLDRTLREQMSKNAKLRAKEFVWQRYQQQLSDALNLDGHCV